MSLPDEPARGSEQWAHLFRGIPSRAHSIQNAPGNQPQLASWKPPRQKEGRSQSILRHCKWVARSFAEAHSLRRLAFHHFPHNFPRAWGVVGQDVKLRPSSLLVHAAIDSIFVKSSNQEITRLAG